MATANLGIRIVLEDGARAGFDALGLSAGRLPGIIGALAYGFERLTPATQALGVTAAASGLLFGGLLGVLTYSIHAAADVQDSMANIVVAVDGANDHYQQLQDTITSVSDNSIYSVQQVADAFVAMGQRVQDATDLIDGVGQAGIYLAEATRSDTVPAAALLAQTMQMFHTPASQAIQDANYLAYAFEHGIPSVSGLSQAISQSGGYAYEAGIPFNQFVLTLSYLATQLGSGERAGTALRYMISALFDPTAKAQKELSALGIVVVNQDTPAFQKFRDVVAASGTAGATAAAHYDGTVKSLNDMYTAAQKVNALHTDKTFFQYAVSAGLISDKLYDANGNFVGLYRAIDILGASIDKLNPQQKAIAIQQLFNVRGNQAVLALATNYHLVHQRMAALQQIENTYSAQKNAETKTNTLNGALSRLKTNIFTAAAAMGKADLGPFTAALSRLSDVLGAISSNPHFAKMAGDLLMFSTIAAGSVFGMSTLGFAFRAVSENAKIFAKIGSGFGDIFGNWGSTVFGPLAEGERRAGGFVGMLHKFADFNAATFQKPLQALTSGLASKGGDFWKLMSLPSDEAGVIINDAFAKLRYNMGTHALKGLAFHFPRGMASKMIEEATGGADMHPHLAFLGGAFKDIGEVMKGGLAGAVTKVGGAFSGLWSTVLGLGPALVSLAPVILPIVAVVLLVAGAIAIVVLLFTKFHKQANDIINVLKSAFKPMFEMVSKAVSGNIADIRKEWNKVEPDVNKAMTGLAKAFHNMAPLFTFLGVVIGAVLSLVIAALGGVIKGFIAALPMIINVFTGIFNVVGWVVRAVVDLLHGNFIGAFKDVMNALGSLKDVFLNMFGAIWAFVSGIIGNILGAIGNLLQSISKIPGLGAVFGGGGGKNVSHKIPGLANGGVVTGPTLAVVGEGREPEVVLPVSKLAAFMGNMRSGGGGGEVTHIHLHVGENEVADIMMNRMTGQLKQVGAGRMFR